MGFGLRAWLEALGWALAIVILGYLIIVIPLALVLKPILRIA